MLSQAQVLNKILQTKDFSIVTLNNLTEEFFFNYKNEFNYIKNHYEKYHTIPDAVTFVNVFQDFKIMDVNEPNTFLIEQLTTDYNGRYLANKFNKIKSMLENDQIDDAVNYFMSSVQNIRAVSAVQCTDLMESTHRYDLYTDRLQGNVIPYIGTGFKELDELIGGIDPLEENMVIAARTGIGKSWTLLKMAVAASVQGKKVGIYSGEMSADKVGYRFDTLMAREVSRFTGTQISLSNKELMRGQDYKHTSTQYRIYFELLEKCGFGPVKVITPADIAGPATVNALQAFIEKEHLDILFIDQYSLLEAAGGNNRLATHEIVASISKAVKNLQVMKQIPIISVAQMNRTKNEDKTKDTTQIGLTDRIGQDATVVLMLDKEEAEDGTYEMSIETTKVRDGGDNKRLVYAVNLDLGEFIFINEESAKAKKKAKEGAKEEIDRYAQTEDGGYVL